MSKTRPASNESVAAPSAPSAAPRSRAGLRRAEVLGIAGEDTVLVRLHHAATEEVLRAEIAVMGYVPAAGDRVLVEASADGWFVLGVLGAARRRAAAPSSPPASSPCRTAMQASSCAWRRAI
jgi:hypothetical protein